MIDLFLTSESQKREEQDRKIINERLHSMVQSRKCKESTICNYVTLFRLNISSQSQLKKNNRRLYVVSYKNFEVVTNKR